MTWLTVVSYVMACWLGWPRDARPHGSITTTVLFDREIVRILDAHCVMCHSDQSIAFPLSTYEQTWVRGRDIRTEAYMAKIFGDTQSFHAADRCMEIHGGMGLATDLPIEKFWRDQRSMMITEGPIEILKMTLARHVLRTYG